MTNYYILLPPSEGKKQGGVQIYDKVKEDNHFNFLAKDRDFILNNLLDFIQNANLQDLQKLFAVKSNIDQILSLFINFNQKLTLPAIKRYSGVMFQAISYDNLDQYKKNNANESILFIDALFGILKAPDLIPDYKLSISAKINNLKIDNFWKKILKKHLNIIFKDKIIIDILPKAHRKIIDINDNWQYYSVSFFIKKNNQLSNAGHISKKLKGEFIRYILNFNKINLDILHSFKHSEGYLYSEELSCKNEIIFFNNIN